MGTARDDNMTLIGCALIGAPYVNFTGGEITQIGGHPVPPLTGYFTELTSPVQTYGVVAAQAFGAVPPTHGNGINHAGPIHFNGALGEVALWKRSLEMNEAQAWFDSRNIW
jgi:hypothetical protein